MRISYFFFIKNMDLKTQITEYLQTNLIQEPVFLIEVLVQQIRSKQKVVVILDGEPITIDDCATVSRKLGAWLETENLVDEAYLLEVSSFGVDQPLRLKRQYSKNIGRNLQIELADSETVTGVLQATTEENITLQPERKNKKKASEENPEMLTIAFADIKKAKILIKF